MAEVTKVNYIDIAGVKWSGAIVGYGVDGNLPPEYLGPKLSAKDAKLEGVYVEGVNCTNQDKPERVVVEAKEFKAHDLSQNEGEKPNLKAFVDLMVEFGNSKRGRVTNFVPNMRRIDDLPRGGMVKPKAHFEVVYESKPEAPKEESKSVKSEDKPKNKKEK